MEKEFVKRFIKDTVLTTFGTGSSVFFHFISIILLSRFLPKDDLGLYFLIMAAVHILIVVGGLGLDLTLVHFLSLRIRGQRQNACLPIIMSRVFMIGALCVCIALFSAPLLNLIDHRTVTYGYFLAVIFVLGSFRDLMYNALQGLGIFRGYTLVQSGSALLRLSLILYLIWSGSLSVQTLLYLEIVVNLGSCLAQALWLPFGRLTGDIEWKSGWGKVFRFSTPLYVNNILTLIMDRANVFLIGYFVSLQGVAVYEVANKIPEGLFRIFRAFIVVYFPNLSKLFAAMKLKDAQALLNQSLMIFSVGLSFLVLGIFIFRREIVVLIFSDAYVTAALPLFLLAVNFYLRVISNIMGYSIVSAGRPAIPMVANMFSSAVLISANFFFLPRYGVIGAIVALLLMNISSQIVYGFNLIKTGISLDIFDYANPFLAAVVICGFYSYMDFDPIPFRLLCLVAYGGSCLFYVRYRKRLVSGFLNGYARWIGSHR